MLSKILLTLGCYYRLFKYRSIFRPAILILERYNNSNWIAGVEYDNDKRLFIGWLYIEGGVYCPEEVRANLHKMRWFYEWHSGQKFSAWKIVLD